MKKRFAHTHVGLKVYLPLLGVLVLLSGCFGRKKTTQHADTLVLDKKELEVQGQEESHKQSIFAQDYQEGFSLEQDVEASPFDFDQQQARQLEFKPELEDTVDHEQWLERQRGDQITYNVKSIYFDFDRSSIRPDQKFALDHDVARVKKLTKQGKTIIIEGHSCKHTGSEPYNVILSEKRAEIVRDYFVKKGVPVDQLKIVGRGAQMCIVPEGSIEQQAPNRRVEVHVL